MLLMDPVPRLRDRLVSLLCEGSPASVEDLLASLRREGRTFTKQAVYKELRLLEDGGVVVRSRGTYRITLTWIFGVLSHTERLMERLSGGDFAFDLIPAPGKSSVWKFTSNRNTDRLWVQLTTSLLQTVEDSRVFQSLPHPWHSLLYRDLDAQIAQVFRMSDARIYCVVGGDTYLDRLFIKNFPKDGSLCANAPGLFDTNDPVYLTIIGPFLISTHYSVKFTRAVDAYFHRIRSKADIRVEEVVRLFESPGTITTKIECSEKKAVKIRRRFERYFGLPPRRSLLP